MWVCSENSKGVLNIKYWYVKAYDKKLCSSFQRVHTLAGCDFNTAFYKMGKQRPLQLLRESES